MSKGRVSEFMLELVKRLQEEKKVAESTATQYVQMLYGLNGRKAFKNLSFLKDHEAIAKVIETYAPSTRKTLLGILVSVLSLFQSKPTYKKCYEYYKALLDAPKEEVKAQGGKSEKQEENWVSWEEVQKKKNELREEVLKIKNSKGLTPKQYDLLLKYIVLSLYTDIAPRRNQDYMDMYVVNTAPEDTSKNYFDISKQEFIFNVYKTAKKYGKQVVKIPNTQDQPLMDALMTYIKFHPLHKGRVTKNTHFRLLVKQDGTPLASVNSITRLLNGIFKKNIGSSMLRHIYITNKYGDIKQEMEEDSEAMGHSVDEQQKVYNVPGSFKQDA